MAFCGDLTGGASADRSIFDKDEKKSVHSSIFLAMSSFLIIKYHHKNNEILTPHRENGAGHEKFWTMVVVVGNADNKHWV